MSLSFISIPVGSDDAGTPLYGLGLIDSAGKIFQLSAAKPGTWLDIAPSHHLRSIQEHANRLNEGGPIPVLKEVSDD
jgi:hypothetical protein